MFAGGTCVAESGDVGSWAWEKTRGLLVDEEAVWKNPAKGVGGVDDDGGNQGIVVQLTSGKVPLEKTLVSSHVSMSGAKYGESQVGRRACWSWRWMGAGWVSVCLVGVGKARDNSHQQASLAASTVADDDELSADLSGHCG